MFKKIENESPTKVNEKTKLLAEHKLPTINRASRSLQSGELHPGGGVVIAKPTLIEAESAVRALIKNNVKILHLSWHGEQTNHLVALLCEVRAGLMEYRILLFERMGTRLAYCGDFIDGVYVAAP